MRVPTIVDLSQAWGSLSQAQTDYIGFLALIMVFNGFLDGSAYEAPDKVLSDPIARSEANDRSNAALTEIFAFIEDALPDLFGPAGDNPTWSKKSEGLPASRNRPP